MKNLKLNILVVMLVALTGCTTTPQYTISLDNFWVTYPRSKYTDTVSAAIGVAVRNPINFEFDDLTFGKRYVTDISHGGVNVGFEQSFVVTKNSDLFKIAVGLENVNDHQCGGGSVVLKVFEREGDMPTPFGIGPIWPADSSFTEHGVWCGSSQMLCDGIVAADGAFVSGAELESMTADGPSTRTVMFPGTDSPWGCGRNSLYYMTWTIRRDR